MAVAEHFVFRNCFFKSSYALLDGFYEEDDVVALGLGEVAELLYSPACVTLCVSVPHDGFERVAGTAVVQTVFSTCAEQRQSATPKWSGAAPTCADVVLHEETMLYKVGVRPNLLMRVARHVIVAEQSVRILNVVVASLPRWTVA